MHDDYADDAHHGAENGGALARTKAGLSVVVGAGVAVLMVAGSVVWLLDLSERRAAEIPVLRASTEPAKLRPADPGGAETPHLDIRSYEITQNDAQRSDDIQLAPPRERLSEEDIAMGELATRERQEDALGEELDSLTPAPRPASLGTADSARAAAVVIGAPAAGGTDRAPAYAPVAAGRPKDLAKRFSAAASRDNAAAELVAQAAQSRVLIQLGAFPDRGDAETQWQRIYRRNGDILAGRVLVVQPTASGGSTFHRLRAGPFRDRTEANAVCEALRARGQDCLVATNQAAG